MMITIHGLAPKTKYQDVKILIKQECNIDDFILDNLVMDNNGTKKVRIGLPDENEGFKLMKCLNGYRMPGNFLLKVVPVSKAANTNVPPSPGGYDSRAGYPSQRNDYPNQRSDYMGQGNQNDYNRGPHGPNTSRGSGPHASSGPHSSSGPHGSLGPHGSSGPHGPTKPYGPGSHSQGPMDTIRPSPWSANSNNSNQWGQNQTMSTQVPQNSFNYSTGSQQNIPSSSFTQQHSDNNQPLRSDMRSYDQGRQGQPAEQSYGGLPPKDYAPPGVQHLLRRNLRSIDTLDNANQVSAPAHGRYPPSQPYQQDKPVTIMKDNFQGPTQHNINNPGEHRQQYPQQAATSPWQSHQAPLLKPQFSKSSPTLGYDKPFDDRKYPQGDRDLARDPKILQSRPDTYKEYEKRRGFSPPGRREEPMQRRISPSRREDPMHRDPPGRMGDMGHRRQSPSGRMGDAAPRRVSPQGRRDVPQGRRDDPQGRRDDPQGRRDDPQGRRDDPQGRRDDPQGRRDDPHGRRFSPPGKRISPSGERRNIQGHPGMRHDSPPHKRLPPTRRLASPERRDDRPGPRFSPPRHHQDKIGDKYGQDDKDLKKVRPAYEPPSSHAPNQAMYSGGYRAGINDSAQYPVSGMRQEQPDTWQRHRDEPNVVPVKKPEDDRHDARMQLARSQVEKHFSPARKSRSPNRRDRSPVRDRYKRTSTSPQSYTSRRSWALEKRRSPDAPPPPVWPGQNNEHPRNRPSFPEKDEKPKHQPVWEGRSFKEEELRNRRPEERREFTDAKIRVAKDIMEREAVPQAAIKDRYQREPKFSPRDDYEERYRRRDSPDRKPLYRDDLDLQRRGRDDERPDDYNRRRESPRRDARKEGPLKMLDKDFEDIYNRTMQFKKRAEEMRKSNSKKSDQFDDDRRHGDKVREDIQQRYDERSRNREEESLRLRERDERHDDRLRDDRPRDDRLRDERPRDDRLRDDRLNRDDDNRGDYRPRDNQQNERERDKFFDDNKLKRSFYSNTTIRQKREKAINEIAGKIIERNDEYKHVQGEQRQRILDELQLAVARIVYDMFGDSDVSFIEVIIKYQARYTLKDEAKILQEVMQSLPKPFRTIKRHGPESSDVPAKIARHSPNADLNQGPAPRPKLSDSSFNVNLAPPSVISMPCIGIPPSQPIMNQPMVPMMVSAPFYQTFDSLQHNMQNPVFITEPVQPVDYPQPVQPVVDYPQPVQPVIDIPQQHTEEDAQEGFRLYLCKDDFDRITNMEGDLLKDFLISQTFQATSQYEGWSPDFTLKGLQTFHRYEVVTRDEWSRDWLMNLDFSQFTYFNVLVYTKEELWYERAAIWLPGHSRVRNIAPLDKLKLQNKKLEGVNIEKWKFVKKIVNEKGTRLYVDMSPASARALEVHDMKLSYELQQVSVFLKAVAVDKDSFDAGLKELSLTTPAEIAESIKNAPMPSLTNDPALVKIILKGSKSLDLVQARKIKEVVIYNLFQYHQQDGLSRTDFVKYGFLQPNYFAILPLNQESKRWLMGCSFGKVNRQVVVVIGGEEDSTRFFKMTATVPFEQTLRVAHVVERLKHSNQGVKGINFNMWKSLRVKPVDRKKARYEVEIDLESLETMSKMRYQLDYVDSTGLHTMYFRSEYSQSGLEELIKKYKAEMTDSYDVANMDLESESSSDSNEDVICLD